MLKSRVANIGQSAQFGERNLEQWNSCEVGEIAHIDFLSTAYVPGRVWIEVASSFITKAVASARLRALILA